MRDGTWIAERPVITTTIVIHAWKVPMEISEFTPLLQQLIIRFQSWDEAQGEAPESDEARLSAAEREALLDELRSVVGEGAASHHPATPWQAFVDFLSAHSSPGGERARREHALLCCYEQLCELDLPFHVSSMLLRHHGLIKRAANVADGRLHLPTPPRGSATSRASTPGPGTAAR